jgi:hypothetical protein
VYPPIKMKDFDVRIFTKNSCTMRHRVPPLNLGVVVAHW